MVPPQCADLCGKEDGRGPMPSKIIYVCYVPPLYHICSWSPSVFLFLFVLIAQKQGEGKGRRREKEAGRREPSLLFPSPVLTSKSKHLQGQLASIGWSQVHSAPEDLTSKGVLVSSLVTAAHPQQTPSCPWPPTTSRPPPRHFQLAGVSSTRYHFFTSCADKGGFYLCPFQLLVPRSSLSAIRRERSFPDMLQGCKGIVCTNKCLRLSFSSFQSNPFYFPNHFSSLPK